MGFDCGRDTVKQDSTSIPTVSTSLIAAVYANSQLSSGITRKLPFMIEFNACLRSYTAYWFRSSNASSRRQFSHLFSPLPSLHAGPRCMTRYDTVEYLE